MFGLGTSELLIVLALVLMLFGGSRIPQLFKGLGEGIRNFKQGLKDEPENLADSRRERQLPGDVKDSPRG